ncbi:MAG: phosphate uptake regulator PhoU [Methanoregula sp.]|nr:phosphate uptake regulator PhoU [Methanoregula sp.]
MEIRKVQFTGGSSYVITLPKEWIEQEKIKKNDPIGVEIQPDGTLLVTKATEAEPLQRIKEFSLEGMITDPSYLFRLLIGAYISGYTTIIIRSNERLPPFVRMVVRDFTQMTIGQEVIEETDTGITIKDLLNPIEMPFINTIKRMYVIVKTMHEDAMTGLITKNRALVQDVTARDNDVDRLHWLIARQTNMILSHVVLSKKMGLSPGMAVHYYIISRIIERIGDHAERIVDNALPLLDKDLDPKILDRIVKASELSVAIFDRSIVSFFNNDIKKSNRNIESVQTLESLCEDLNNLVIQQETLDAIALGHIIESVKRAGEYSADISENVINYLVEEEMPVRKKNHNSIKVAESNS